MLSQYDARVLSEWLWNGSSRRCYYPNHSCFHIQHAEFLLWDLYILKSSQLLSWPHLLLLFILSSSSPLCRVFILIFLRQTMSPGNTVLHLLLLIMVLTSLVPVLNLLYFYIRTFRSMCAVPNMAVFWSSLTSCFPGMLLTYFLNDSEIVPVTPIITGITFVFTCAVFLL